MNTACRHAQVCLGRPCRGLCPACDALRIAGCDFILPALEALPADGTAVGPPQGHSEDVRRGRGACHVQRPGLWRQATLPGLPAVAQLENVQLRDASQNLLASSSWESFSVTSLHEPKGIGVHRAQPALPVLLGKAGFEQGLSGGTPASSMWHSNCLFCCLSIFGGSLAVFC